MPVLKEKREIKEFEESKVVTAVCTILLLEALFQVKMKGSKGNINWTSWRKWVKRRRWSKDFYRWYVTY